MMKFLFQKKKALRICFFILFWFFLTRIVLTLCGMSVLGQSGALLIENPDDPLYENVERGFLEDPYNLILTTWIHWDSKWYLKIAEDWYPAGSYGGGTSPVVFFPLYPLLIKIFSFLFWGNFKLSGLFISNICLILSAYVLYKLVLMHWDSEKLARDVVVFLFLFPVSFFFSSILSESLFLLLTLLTFYFSKKTNWFYASLSGLFASLTRSTGWLLFIPIFFEYFKSKKFNFKKIDLKLGYLLLIPLGTLLYFSYLYFLTGDFLVWFKVEKMGWGIHFSFEHFLNFFKNGLFSGTLYPAFNVWFTFLALMIVILAYKEFARCGLMSYFIFSLIFIVLPIFFVPDPMISRSLPRYSVVVFPLFIYFALLGKNSQLIDDALKLFFAILQFFLMGFWSLSLHFVV